MVVELVELFVDFEGDFRRDALDGDIVDLTGQKVLETKQIILGMGETRSSYIRNVPELAPKDSNSFYLGPKTRLSPKEGDVPIARNLTFYNIPSLDHSATG